MRTALAAMAAALAAGPWMASEAATPSPCRLRGVEHPAQCLMLSRPLDPTRANGPAIELHVAVLPALSRHKKPDPVFFIAGGPGQSAIELAGQAARLLGRLGQRRDIVLVDQRGTGRSAPLTCEEDRSDALDRRVDPVAMRQALARCRTALQQLPHGDLRHYATPVAVQDLEAVRRHLGLERVNVVGVSYGTRVALEWLRQSPGAVRRAVLDGVSPPDQALPASSVVDARAAFDALLAWCRDDAACSRAHPDLAGTWQALRAAPARTATVAHPLTGRPQVLTLDADRLDALVRAALYTPVLASALPHALAEAAAGHPAALLGLA
ncbi:MAG: alpha/beta fold hydrolase, partial [Rubrivivax sp.]|nr:alpha/beta fold hydrolase [Rubrivivax sp.]